MSSTAVTPRIFRTSQSLSLRWVLQVGVGGLLCLGLAAALILQGMVLSVANKQQAASSQASELLLDNRKVLQGLLDQETGLRGYLSSGEPRFLEPLERGRLEERQSMMALVAHLGAKTDSLNSALLVLQDTIDAWHSHVEDPQLAERRTGTLQNPAEALAAGKVFFDDIRSAQTELDTQLMARAERERAESRAELRNVQVATFVTASLLFLFGAVFVRAILQQTVRPLATLSRLAQSGEPFSRPSQDIHIREIGLLTDALVTLDREARLRARLVETAHADAVDLSAFGELVQQLADEQELYGVLGRRLSEVAHPVRHNILVRNASKNRLRIASSSDPVLDEPERFPILSKPLACRAVRSLRPIVSSPGAISCCDCPLGVPDQGAYVCFPMLAAGEVVGVVNLQLETPLETSVQQRCGGYVNLAASALSSISHLASAKERTLRDAMTGAYNRGFLQEYLPKLVAQSTRRGSPFALLMFDLDRFKRLNDTYGHQVGDQALVSFSSCLHQQVRSGDAVVRYGGEEFLVLLADTDTPGAMIVAERIRAAVERIVVTTAKETLGPILRCSIGVASCPTHARDDRSLIAAADRALYQAKNTGRNKVVLAELSTSANETPAQGHKVSSTTADSDDATAALPAVA